MAADIGGAVEVIGENCSSDPKNHEDQMIRQPVFSENNEKSLEPKADDQSHEPAKHIEEIARLSSSRETAKDPNKVRRSKD